MTIREMHDALLGEGFYQRYGRVVERQIRKMPKPRPSLDELVSAGLLVEEQIGEIAYIRRNSDLPRDVLDSSLNEFLQKQASE